MIDPEQFVMVLAVAVLPKREWLAVDSPLIMLNSRGERTTITSHLIGEPKPGEMYSSVQPGDIERQAHDRIDQMSRAATELQALRGPAAAITLADVWRD